MPWVFVGVLALWVYAWIVSSREDKRDRRNQTEDLAISPAGPERSRDAPEHPVPKEAKAPQQ